MRPRAVAFDFNGTLSQDEPILCEIFMELFAEEGRPLSAEEYFAELAGLSDPEIVRTWLGREYPGVDALVAERVRRYRATVADGSTVSEEVQAAVRYAAERVPVAVVSGAARVEVESVLDAAGLRAWVAVIVSADDVTAGKPDPESYRLALARFDDDIHAEEVVVFEDTEAGVAAAKDAGMPCLAVLGTLTPERLGQADEIVERIDVDLMRRLLG